MKNDMLINVNGAAVASDYRRRNIKPDEITPVRQGILLSWRFNNTYVCVLLPGARNYNGELLPGQIMLYDGPYINTYSFQSIADNIV